MMKLNSISTIFIFCLIVLASVVKAQLLDTLKFKQIENYLDTLVGIELNELEDEIEVCFYDYYKNLGETRVEQSNYKDIKITSYYLNDSITGYIMCMNDKQIAVYNFNKMNVFAYYKNSILSVAAMSKGIANELIPIFKFYIKKGIYYETMPDINDSSVQFIRNFNPLKRNYYELVEDFMKIEDLEMLNTRKSIHIKNDIFLRD